MILGIDVGLTGQIAVLSDHGEWVACHQIPTRTRGKKTVEVNPTALMKIFRDRIGLKSIRHVGIEAAIFHTRGGREGSLKGRYHQSYAFAVATVELLRLPHTIVHPVSWKTTFQLTGKKKVDKQDACDVARRVFPHGAQFLTLKRHHDRADAALIALHLLRKGVIDAHQAV